MTVRLNLLLFNEKVMHQGRVQKNYTGGGGRDRASK